MSVRAAQRRPPGLARGWRAAWRPGAVLVSAGAALAVTGLLDPNVPGHYPTCPFLALTGWYCPGCGSLRAMHALAHGDLPTALARNPLMVAAAVGLAVLWLRWLLDSARGRVRTTVAPAWLLRSGAGLLLAYGVLRNLPGMQWLAP